MSAYSLSLSLPLSVSPLSRPEEVASLATLALMQKRHAQFALQSQKACSLKWVPQPGRNLSYIRPQANRMALGSQMIDRLYGIYRRLYGYFLKPGRRRLVSPYVIRALKSTLTTTLHALRKNDTSSAVLEKAPLCGGSPGSIA